MTRIPGASVAKGSHLGLTWMTEGNLARNPFHSTTLSIKDFTLECVAGPHQGMSLLLEQELLHIGRASWCEIPLTEDKRISRHHCELRVTSEGLHVRDLESRNGTFLGGLRVFEALLIPGITLQVGSSHFQLKESQSRRQIKVNYHDNSGRLVGCSPEMRKIFTILNRLGPADAPVLLLGETGTGKTSIAAALHEQSKRADKPFVTVNCGSLPSGLIESSLFGYEKGAFTGANQQHLGFFEQANGGTLFLDEIGELPLELQPKLLDVLERKKVRRLGGMQEIPVDFRLVSATHRNLSLGIEQKTFREDLYYRLAVMELEVPSLRQRMEDIPFLAEHILSSLQPNRALELDDSAIQLLQSLEWSGNVRELRNTLERSLLFLDGDVLTAEEIVLPRTATAAKTAATPEKSEAGAQGVGDILDGRTLSERLDAQESQILKATLEALNWDIPKAVQQLGVSRSALYNRLKKYGIERQS
jgi:DNA-binding NtrC family response regulator